MRPIRAAIRPFTRAIVLSFLWNNRRELARWYDQCKQSVIKLVDAAREEIAARRAERVTEQV